MTEINNLDQNNDQVAMNLKRNKIVSLRYKVYIFVLVVIIFFFRPIFIETVESVRGKGALDGIFSLSELPNIVSNIHSKRGEEGGVLNEIDDADKKIAEIERKIKKVHKEQEVIERLNDEKKRNTIIACLNTEDCSGVPEELLSYLGLFRIYLLINNLTFDKMHFNQKVVLKNINDFLLKKISGTYNGILLSINFGDTAVFNEEYDIYMLPIGMTIVFENEKMLLDFLSNVEEKIHTLIPVFYKIDAMNYNIVEYEHQQEVNVNLNAYYIASLPTGAVLGGDIATGKIVTGSVAVEDTGTGNMEMIDE